MGAGDAVVPRKNPSMLEVVILTKESNITEVYKSVYLNYDAILLRY